MDIVFGIILLIAALFLVVAVLMQSGKSHNLSGAIAGGNNSYLGNSPTSSKDKLLFKITAVLTVVLAILVLALYIIL